MPIITTVLHITPLSVTPAALLAQPIAHSICCPCPCPHCCPYHCPCHCPQLHPLSHPSSHVLWSCPLSCLLRMPWSCPSSGMSCVTPLVMYAVVMPLITHAVSRTPITPVMHRACCTCYGCAPCHTCHVSHPSLHMPWLCPLSRVLLVVHLSRPSYVLWLHPSSCVSCVTPLVTHVMCHAPHCMCCVSHPLSSTPWSRLYCSVVHRTR